MTATLGKIEKVEIKKVWPKEDTSFTPWLATPENMALLGKELNIDLEPLGQEERVGPYRADILCKDIATEQYVVIENQYSKSDHDHLGKSLTYASGLNATTVIWIAEKFSEEHRAVLDWLNTIANNSVEFFGVEIELIKIDNSAPAPIFNIVSKPNNWSKSIKRNAYDTSLSESKLLKQSYWQSLKEYIEKQKVSFNMQKPLPQNWTNIAIGRTDFKICAVINPRDKWICTQLVISGSDCLENFKRLKELYETDSVKKLSNKLEWAEKEGGKEHHINFVIDDTDPMNKNDWPNQHKLLKEWIEKFYNYFKEKIRNL